MTHSSKKWKKDKDGSVESTETAKAIFYVRSRRYYCNLSKESTDEFEELCGLRGGQGIESEEQQVQGSRELSRYEC